MNMLRIVISGESEIAEAARQARHSANTMGFSKPCTHYVATVASELAASLYSHAGGGVFEIAKLADPEGLELTTVDDGPGIADVDLALKVGFSTAESWVAAYPASSV